VTSRAVEFDQRNRDPIMWMSPLPVEQVLPDWTPRQWIVQRAAAISRNFLYRTRLPE
jgi:hypothetical protein